MRIRPFMQHDLARLVELTIETFRPFYEESFRPLVGEVVFANQHGSWPDDYRRQVPKLHDRVGAADRPARASELGAWRSR